MKDGRNKAVALTKLLNPTEVDGFNQHLAGKEGKALKTVFNFIRAQGVEGKLTEAQKQKLFKKLYDKPYTKEDDYLLRNLLRHLSSELTVFMALQKLKEETSKQPLEASLFFLRSLQDRKAYDLFEVEWKRLFGLAIKQMNMDVAEQLQRMMIDHCVHHGSVTVERYERLLSMIAEHLELQKQDFLHTHLHAMHMRAFTQRMLQGLGKEQSISELETVSLDPYTDAKDDPYLSYLRLLIASYSLKGQPRIDVLEEACGLVGQIDPKKKNMESALASASASIALEYFLMHAYEASLPYHNKALKNSKNLPDEQVVTFAFNYLSTFIRLDRYEDAIGLIIKYEPQWSDLPKMKDRFLCLKAMCHLFLGDHAAAADCIPENRKEGGMDHYYYYRFIQVVILYTKGQLELAMTEASNFEHTIRYNDGNEDGIHLIRYILKFFAFKANRPALDDDVYRLKCTQLKEELTKYIDTTFSDHLLVYRWLLVELNRYM